MFQNLKRSPETKYHRCYLHFPPAWPIFGPLFIHPCSGCPPSRTPPTENCNATITPTTTLNPSLAVERIREIIVGRHLEKLESRVALIESGESRAQVPTSWEDRLCTVEARLEALQHSVQRINDSQNEESAMRTLQQREEIQRLATQIQQVAALKSANDPQPAIDRLEQKIGTWLNNWQGALQTHLSERETRIASQIRGEVATLWESTESQLTRLQSRVIDREMIEERFSRIAAAARALAESAAPFTSGNEYAKP